MKVKTKGLSPKVLADLLVSVIAFVPLFVAVDLDPEWAAAIAKVLGSLAAMAAGPGQVEPRDGEWGSDALLKAALEQRGRDITAEIPD